MFRRVGRGIWLGLHAGQALPASETLPTSVDPRRRSDPAAASGQPEFDWYYAELYAAPIGRVVRVAKKLQLAGPMLHCGNMGERSCNDCIDRGSRGARIDGGSIQPIRYVAAAKRFVLRRPASWQS